MGRNELFRDGGVVVPRIVILSEVIASRSEAITQSKDPYHRALTFVVAPARTDAQRYPQHRLAVGVLRLRWPIRKRIGQLRSG